MTDLQTSLLNNNSSFDQLYEIVRQQLVDFQQGVDELQILGESEIDQFNINQVFQSLKVIQIQQLSIKDSILKLEQQSRGVEQRNKTKKLRDLYTTQQQRSQQLYKSMINDCSYESLKETIKEIEKMMKLTNKQDVQNCTMNQQNKKQNTQQSSQSSQQQQQQYQQQVQLQDMEPLETYEHLDWHNQILKQNQDEINQIQEKTYVINKIVQDLALEVEHQDTYFDVIETNVTTTKENVVKTQEQLTKTGESQQSNKKKLICMLVCAGITFLTVLLILVL